MPFLKNGNQTSKKSGSLSIKIGLKATKNSLFEGVFCFYNTLESSEV